MCTQLTPRNRNQITCIRYLLTCMRQVHISKGCCDADGEPLYHHIYFTGLINTNSTVGCTPIYQSRSYCGPLHSQLYGGNNASRLLLTIVVLPGIQSSISCTMPLLLKHIPFYSFHKTIGTGPRNTYPQIPKYIRYLLSTRKEKSTEYIVNLSVSG